jgi:hypothetical protein
MHAENLRPQPYPCITRRRTATAITSGRIPHSEICEVREVAGAALGRQPEAAEEHGATVLNAGEVDVGQVVGELLDPIHLIVAGADLAVVLGPDVVLREHGMHEDEPELIVVAHLSRHGRRFSSPFSL